MGLLAALAGLLLQVGVTPGWCFVVNAASFLAVIAALLLIRTEANTPNSSTSFGSARLQ